MHPAHQLCRNYWQKSRNFRESETSCPPPFLLECTRWEGCHFLKATTQPPPDPERNALRESFYLSEPFYLDHRMCGVNPPLTVVCVLLLFVSFVPRVHIFSNEWSVS